MNFLFWCEFPERINFEKLNNLFKENNFTAKFGIVCTSKEDFLKKKEFLSTFSNLKLVRAWPILPKEQGYWFSSFSSKDAIDSLDQYQGMAIKIDVEPPIPIVKNYTSNPLKMQWFFWNHFVRKGKNLKYFQEKLLKLSKTTDIMLSTFSFPKFILERHGVIFAKQFKYNFIYYSSFIPRMLRPMYRAYLKPIIKARLKHNPTSSFAVGLLSPGIFLNEPCYKSPKELEADVKFLKERGVQNIVVFRLGSFLEIDNPQAWIEILKRA